jgi:hypothetical protein
MSAMRSHCEPMTAISALAERSDWFSRLGQSSPARIASVSTNTLSGPNVDWSVSPIHRAAAELSCRL